jgi:curved DNA-binding protein CbpA
MNVEEACNIFQIYSFNNIDGSFLKKKYYKLSLLHHPDKHNNSRESNERFKKINMAYELLKQEINEEEVNEEKENNVNYEYFLKKILKKYDFIYHFILNNYENMTIQLFEGINKETSINLYHFLLNHKSILHISNELVEKVKEIILEKYKDVTIYILKPTLNELFGERIFILELFNKTFFVPLWHSELEFDKDVIVKCIPDLPENIIIDENNNLIVNIKTPFSSLLEKNYINVNVNNLFIPINELFIKKEQYYIFKEKGISKIDENNMYNISSKADVIVFLTFF